MTVGLSSPLKEVMLRTFITLKNPLSWSRFEPANLGYNGKHSNHYTTEGDDTVVTSHRQTSIHVTKFTDKVQCKH
jgi:hypothetical protein